MLPPAINPVDFLQKRICWRYAWGTPEPDHGKVLLGDSRNLLPTLEGELQESYQLLLTSPPYHQITNYYYDQWLRYWMLGGPELPTNKGEQWRSESKQHSRKRYQDLLRKVFCSSAKLLHSKATVYVRTDARKFTKQATQKALQEAFPNKEFMIIQRPFTRSTQTALFGDSKPKPGELDIVLRS
jgi:hypothetical protein